MRFSLILLVSTLFSLATAHGNRRRASTLEELAREEIRAREHAVMARNCESQIREHVAMRMKRRADIREREAEDAGLPAPSPARHPYYTSIQNMTCLTSPEVLEGPYYVNNELVRQDIRETQKGVKLLVDFGVVDTSTCEPMNRAFVEIWQANATGVYSGYSTSATSHSDIPTWLRGGWYTDTNGIVELITIYPGFYDDRSTHIHLMVHKDSVQSANGTLVSHSGTVLHIGQAFFPDSWSDEVYRTSPYTLNAYKRTLNSRDSYLPGVQQDGYMSFMSLQYLNGRDLSGGLVGYITLGVDSRSSYTITSKNYNGQK